MHLKTAFFCILIVIKGSCSQQFENFTSEHSIDENGYDLSFYIGGNKSVSHSETGRLVKTNDTVFVRVEGFFRYIGDDNNLYLVEYSLDENGYKFETSVLNDDDIGLRLSSVALASLAGGGLG